jgi:hypothetical protein
MQPAIKDSKNPFYKNTYADLNSIWNSLRAPFSKNGLSVIQQTEKDGSGQLNLVTTLIHSSGQWLKSALPLNPAKPDIQSLGSTITYLRRYSLGALCGISTEEEDDGERLMDRKKEDLKKQEEPKKKSEPKLSEQQIEELSLILGNCSDEYQKQVWAGLNSQKIFAWEELTHDLYLRVRTAAIKQAKNIPLSVAQ